MKTTPPKTGLVIIGRNKGRRLKACLRSVHHKSQRSIYVDSASSDGSAMLAQSLGFRVVELDPEDGVLSPARARNAGFAALQKVIPGLEYVQFLDGDCVLDPGWLACGERWLETHAETAAVWGSRRERCPNRSLFTMLTDLECDTPLAGSNSFGSEALIRTASFSACCGYDEDLPCGAETDLALRLRQAGGGIQRLAADMSVHDTAVRGFKDWTRRMIRSGYGASLLSAHWSGRVAPAEVPFGRAYRSAILWTDGLLAGALCLSFLGAFFTGPLGATLGLTTALVLWIGEALRTAWSLCARVTPGDAFLCGVFTQLGKWAQRAGHAFHWWEVQTSKSERLQRAWERAAPIEESGSERPGARVERTGG
jgi:GT2 family glycosyltransferase